MGSRVLCYNDERHSISANQRTRLIMLKFRRSFIKIGFADSRLELNFSSELNRYKCSNRKISFSNDSILAECDYSDVRI